jgi:hypothetical protein
MPRCACGKVASVLKAKIGKRSRTRGRRGEAILLPEPSWARTRRIWGNWLEWVLWRAGALCVAAVLFYFLLTPALIFTGIFGGKAMQHHSDNLMQAKTTIGIVFGLFGYVVMAPLAIALWWLRAETGTRLKTAAKFICYATPGIAIFVLWIALIDQIERTMRHSGFFWPWHILAIFASFGVLNASMRGVGGATLCLSAGWGPSGREGRCRSGRPRPPDGHDLRPLPLIERRRLIRSRASRIVRSWLEPADRHRLEGILSKRKDLTLPLG